MPIELRGAVVSVDDTIRPGVTIDSLSSLKPVFPNWGEASTTAGNASGVGDGAALCIMTTRERAEQEGMEIIGKWVGSTVVGTYTSTHQLFVHAKYKEQASSRDTWVFRLSWPLARSCRRSD